MPSPSLNTVELIVIHNCPCEHSSKLQLSIRFTPSRCLDVRQDWYPMYYPEGMKARVSPVQSIEPHRILAPTRDLNKEPPGSESRVVTTILPLHTVQRHPAHLSHHHPFRPFQTVQICFLHRPGFNPICQYILNTSLVYLSLCTV